MINQTLGFCLILIIFAFSVANGQQASEHTVSIKLEDITIVDALKAIDNKLPSVAFFFTDSLLPESKVNFSFSNHPLENTLTEILKGSGYSYVLYRDYGIVIAPERKINQNYSSEYYVALEAGLETQEEDKNIITVGNLDQISPDGNSLISGTVIDQETGDPVIGATILLKQTQNGTATDFNGDFELNLTPGNYDLQFQYIGYQARELSVNIISRGSFVVELEKSAVLLDEVVVQARARDENVASSQSGVSRISTKEIEKLPSFMGEIDIVKGLLLQPGVSTVGEGASGFNVRGGDADQNLIMLDEGILFNATHALGFFSSFNPDMVNDAVLYKGNAPPKYGGRLASVLNINLRDGNFEKMQLRGGIGLASGRLTLETPLIKDKTSLILGARSTYSNWILKTIPVPEVQNSSVSFNDLNLRLTHRFDARNNLSLSLYRSGDAFNYAGDFGFNYQSILGQINYRSILTDKILSTTSVVWGKYNSNQTDDKGFDAASLSIGADHYKFKQNFSYNIARLNLEGGISSILYLVNPGAILPFSDVSIIANKALDNEKGLESAIYAGGDYTISQRWSVSGGLRWTLFQYLGPQTMYEYENPQSPSEFEIIGTKDFTQTFIAKFQHLQPRISARFRLDANSSLKVAYGRTVQYLNQISNSDTPTPTNIWQLSNQYVPPKLAHNFSIGYFNNFDNNNWITSLEVFYRNIDQLFDYKDFADLIVNEHLETELLPGIGRAAGVELGIKKQLGPVNGWVNYTYSRSERKVAGINNNQWYFSNFDKPHDFAIVTNFELNKRNTFTLNFNYSSGRPTTIPFNRFAIGDYHAALNYTDRNTLRIPDYHRLDISYTVGQSLRKSKKFKTSWTFAVYNIYSRRNAFSVFMVQNAFGRPEINRLAILGSAFPSVTFNFELK